LVNIKVEERLEYEKNNIEKNKILMGDDYLNEKENQNENTYEILLRKHESDIRNHIKVIKINKNFNKLFKKFFSRIIK
jgi:hypothetical protein